MTHEYFQKKNYVSNFEKLRIINTTSNYVSETSPKIARKTGKNHSFWENVFKNTVVLWGEIV